MIVHLFKRIVEEPRHSVAEVRPTLNYLLLYEPHLQHMPVTLVSLLLYVVDHCLCLPTISI
jgi:hypothetical protein